jgi:hypothetical protein
LDPIPISIASTKSSPSSKHSSTVPPLNASHNNVPYPRVASLSLAHRARTRPLASSTTASIQLADAHPITRVVAFLPSSSSHASSPPRVRASAINHFTRSATLAPASRTLALAADARSRTLPPVVVSRVIARRAIARRSSAPRRARARLAVAVPRVVARADVDDVRAAVIATFRVVASSRRRVGASARVGARGRSARASRARRRRARASGGRRASPCRGDGVGDGYV